MDNEILILIATAASIGFFHTLLGPDHYLPFIVMSKARNWSTVKTIWITSLCGLGHVGSTVIIGFLGVSLGIGLKKLELVETFRGDWTAWAFLIFGFGYMLWGFWKLHKLKPHQHVHSHGGEVHVHTHDHDHPVVKTGGIPHSHEHDHKSKNLTPWILFLIFVMGPCEPLIPILIYPAAQESTAGLIAVVTTFTVITLVTMVGIVLTVNYGFTFIKTSKLEKYMHVIAGGTIVLSGTLILLGL